MEISDKFQIPVNRGGLGDRFSGGTANVGGGGPERFNPSGDRTPRVVPSLALRLAPSSGTMMPQRHAGRQPQPRIGIGPVDESRKKAIVSTLNGLVNSLEAESIDFLTNVYDRALEYPESITELSRTMSEGEVLTEMVFMIDALERVANKLETGSIQPYLSPENKATLASLHELYNGRRGRVPDTAKEPIAQGHESLSSDYVDQRVKPLENLSADIDRMIVSAEGGLVNVHEPGESRSALEVVGGLALLAVAAYGIYALLTND